MNLQILSAHIVRCVHKSPDSATNLEVAVANLIRDELARSNAFALGDSKKDEFMRDMAKLRRHYDRDFRPKQVEDYSISEARRVYRKLGYGSW